MSGYLFEKRSISDCLGYGSESVGSGLAGGAAAAVGATLEELKAMVEFHLERVAPMLDLKVIPINGTDTEPRDGIADCDAPQGRAGNHAGAPQGRRRASDHRGGKRSLRCAPLLRTYAHAHAREIIDFFASRPQQVGPLIAATSRSQRPNSRLSREPRYSPRVCY